MTARGSKAPLAAAPEDFRHLTKIPELPFDALDGIWHPFWQGRG